MSLVLVSGHTTQKVFFADLVTFTEEILNEKLHFLCRILAAGLVKCIRTFHGHQAWKS